MSRARPGDFGSGRIAKMLHAPLAMSTAFRVEMDRPVCPVGACLAVSSKNGVEQKKQKQSLPLGRNLSVKMNHE